MSRWKELNLNPNHNRVGDCTIRAISLALNQDWDETYAAISAYGFKMKDMPSSNAVWSEYLWENGFEREAIKERGGYTVEDFCFDHPKGVYLLSIEGHIVCVIDGYYYDAWDSGHEVPVYYWERI